MLECADSITIETGRHQSSHATTDRKMQKYANALQGMGSSLYVTALQLETRIRDVPQ